ncbi:MAG: hypothetical protein P9M08_10795 [Candidatus Erginobacter occultus]|nr:hypothetical protein [Candidatus Erginobacter occultus]
MPSTVFAIFSSLWFALLLVIPGGFTALAALRRGRLEVVRGWPEFIYFSFLGSFALFSLAALAAAQVGIFSIPIIGAVLLLYSLGVRIPSWLDYQAPDGRVAVKIFRLIGKDD